MDGCSQNSSDVQLFFDKSTEVVVYPDLFPEEPPLLEAEIKRGFKELKKRQQLASKSKRKAKKAAQKDAPKVTKIIYPAPAKFSGCRHNETIIINREILNPNMHLRLLAMPRVKPTPQYARIVRKTLPPPTNHIKTLAQPKANYVKDTINLHSAHLKPHQIERMKERLNARDYLTIAESRQFARQQKKDEIRWLRHRKRQERILKKKIVRLELDYLQDIMAKVYRQTRNYFLNDDELPLEDELAIASEVILTKICDLIGVDVPQRDGAHILDKYYCQLGDKAAMWMWRIMQSANVTFERPEDVVKRLSAASSLFEDPTKLKQENIEESEGEEELIVDDSTRDIIKHIVESCIATALLALNNLESDNTTEENSYGVLLSVSQTAIRSAPSEETTKTEREKGSKVNFIPRTSSIKVEMSQLKNEDDDEVEQ
ncbi:AAEL006592-PA [Aedes aegypti]|uniref:AAEL006592-PA n=1 Tax=Aedes aegypti TaxID=7159 RepID=Q175P3_AEDAE|nr:AAEL006592-PA [Aedes aegypti]